MEGVWLRDCHGICSPKTRSESMGVPKDRGTGGDGRKVDIKYLEDCEWEFSSENPQRRLSSKGAR